MRDPKILTLCIWLSSPYCFFLWVDIWSLWRNRAICSCPSNLEIQQPGYRTASMTTVIVTRIVLVYMVTILVTCLELGTKSDLKQIVKGFSLSELLSCLTFILRYSCITCHIFGWLWKRNNPSLPQTANDISVNIPSTSQGSYANYHSSDYFDEIPIDIDQYRWIPETYEGSTEPPQCSICIEEVVTIQSGVEISRLPCLHVFHKDCLLYWILLNPTCPICRAAL